LQFFVLMLKIFAAILAVPLVACVTGDAPSDLTSDSTLVPLSAETDHGGGGHTLPEIGADQEYAFFNGKPYTIQFPGFFTPQAETFFIWNLGTSIQHDAPYPSSTHDRIYGVFAPGPPGVTHHVDEQEGFDHYHIMSAPQGTRTFDVFLVFPGPNFNEATFRAPVSEREMDRAIAAGILAAPVTTTDAGFGPLVFKVPVTKVKDRH
jgi:hypothetical protein